MAATHPSLPLMPQRPTPAARRERDQLYASLDVWGDEDTQVSVPVPMSDLVNGTEPRNTNHLTVLDTVRSGEAPCKAPSSGRNAQ